MKQDVFQGSLKWVTSNTRSSSGAIVLVTLAGTPDELVKELVLDAAVSEGYENLEGKLTRFPANAGITGRSYTTGQTTWVPDTTGYPDFIPVFSPNVKSELATPLVRGEEILGTLHVESPAIDNYALSDVELVEFAAGEVTLALSFLTLVKSARTEHSSRLRISR